METFKQNTETKPITGDLLNRYLSNPEDLYTQDVSSFVVSRTSKFDLLNNEHLRRRFITNVTKLVNINLAQEGLLSLFSNNMNLLDPFATTTRIHIQVPANLMNIKGENQLVDPTSIGQGYREGVEEIEYWNKDIRQAFGYQFKAKYSLASDSAEKTTEKFSTQLGIDTPAVTLLTDKETVYQLKRNNTPLKFVDGSVLQTIKMVASEMKAYSTPFSKSKHVANNVILMSNVLFREFVDEFIAETGISSSAAYKDYKVDLWTNKPSTFDAYSFYDIVIIPLYQDEVIGEDEIVIADRENSLVYTPFIPLDYSNTLVSVQQDTKDTGLFLLRRGGRMILDNIYADFNSSHYDQMGNQSPFTYTFSKSATSDLDFKALNKAINEQFNNGFKPITTIVSEEAPVVIEEPKKASKK